MLTALIALTFAASPAPDTTVTLNGNTYNVCAVEDCSDQPGQLGAWQSPRTGLWWISVGESSYPA